MKYLKKFKLFESVEDIDAICRKYNIKNYTINEDKSIDVNENVNLYNMGLYKLPLKFRNVSGYFACASNKLTYLNGCPQSVGNSFNCGNNWLKNLKGCPEHISGDFDCSNNRLVDFEGCPKNVDGDFYCSDNKLTSLEGCPNINNGYLLCDNNKIRSFEGFPEYIGRNFMCIGNPIQEIWKLFFDNDKIELFNDYDIIRDNGQSIILDRLNDFLIEIGKPTVDKVKGYNNI